MKLWTQSEAKPLSLQIFPLTAGSEQQEITKWLTCLGQCWDLIGWEIKMTQFQKSFSCKPALDSPMVQQPSSHLHFPNSLHHSTQQPQSWRLQNQLHYIKIAQIQKSLQICYTSFKSLVTNIQGVFDLSNFYFKKLILQPPTLRPLWASRLRLSGKWRLLFYHSK